MKQKVKMKNNFMDYIHDTEPINLVNDMTITVNCILNF